MAKKFIAVYLFLATLSLCLTTPLSSEEDITKGKRRIAVFPFEVNSPEKKDEFLSAAFPDTLTSALSQVRALILTERGELKRLLEEQKLGMTGIIDPATAAKTGKILGVKTAVLGSFNRIGTKVRAACRFVDVDTAEVDKVHIVKVYKELAREEDLFDLMEELANDLIKTFDIKVMQEEIKQVAMRTEPTQNFSAYEYYIKGREKMLLFDIEGFEAAIPLFQKAIEIDSKYALAYAALSETYYFWGSLRLKNGEEFQTYYDLAYENAKKAIELRPDLSESHRAMANAHGEGKRKNHEIWKKKAQKAVDLNPNDSEAYCSLWAAYGEDPYDTRIQKALALNPRLSVAHNDLGVSLQEKGLLDEAIIHYRKAVEINPRYSFAHSNLGAAFENKGLLDEAIIHHRKAIEINPRYSSAHYNLGVALGQKGLLDEAIIHYRKAIEINPRFSAAHHNMGFAFYSKGLLDEAISSWRKACDLGHQGACDNLKTIGQ